MNSNTASTSSFSPPPPPSERLALGGPVLAALTLAALAASCTPIGAAEISGDRQAGVGTTRVVSPQALHPGDEIEVRVPGHEQLTARIRIPTSGELRVPQLGHFTNPVGGDLEAFTAEVTERVRSQWVRDAVVDVSVASYGPRRVYVLGGVERAGVVELDPFSEMTVMKAISVAGGFADNANHRSVHLVRNDLLQPGIKRHSVLRDLDRPESLETDQTLQHGDLIVVERLDQVYVMGQVNQPGAINIQGDGEMTLLKAISIAGGFDRFAREDRVQLIRGEQPVRSVDLRRVLDGREGASDPALQPGDIIFVQGSDW